MCKNKLIPKRISPRDLVSPVLVELAVKAIYDRRHDGGDSQSPQRVVATARHCYSAGRDAAHRVSRSCKTCLVL